MSDQPPYTYNHARKLDWNIRLAIEQYGDLTDSQIVVMFHHQGVEISTAQVKQEREWLAKQNE